MQFSKLALYFHQLESVSGRLKMTELLAKVYNEATPDETGKLTYLALGQLGPKYSNPEFNMADKMVIRAIAQAYETEPSKVTRLYKKLGDVGETAFELSKKFKSQIKNNSDPTVLGIYNKLLEITTKGGLGSQNRKVQILSSLLQSIDPLSAKYLARISVGKLRLGFSDMTILDALSWITTGDKSLSNQLEDAYNVAADIGLIAQKVKSVIPLLTKRKLDIVTLKNKDEILSDVKGQLSNVKCKLGVPIVAALCQRLKTFDEMLKKMSKVTVEPKYDGTRLQIHWSRSFRGVGTRHGVFLRSFTRNLEENSHMFPELQNLDKELSENIQSIILDCEAIGYDPQNGKALPFQMTITRKRKHDIEDQRSKVAIKFMVFDILYIKLATNSHKRKAKQGDIHNLPLSDRRAVLESIISSPRNFSQNRSSSAQNDNTETKQQNFQLTPQTVTTDPAICRQLHHQYLNQGFEGVVIKKWSSPYVPGRKGWNWVKMKEIETAHAGLADTLDCVVMGYYRGRGQRAKFGLGAFLVGVLLTERNVVKSKSKYEQISGNKHDTLPFFNSAPLHLEKKFLTISKIGTGLTDNQFRDLKQRLTKLKTSKQPQEYVVHKNLHPDVWVKPSLVMEIAADNITKSPTHTANLALRFPRLVKFRDDKSPNQASTIKELQYLYKLQSI
jgi:DNA ligase-1